MTLVAVRRPHSILLLVMWLCRSKNGMWAAEGLHLWHSPVTWGVGEEVELKVNKLTSMKAQLGIDYYRLPC